MLDRESTFANPSIVKRLKTDLIPVAIDQAYQRRQKDPEGVFYRKIAAQARGSDFNRTTQGLYVADADGQLLGFSNHRSPERIQRMLATALERFQPREIAAIDSGSLDQRYNPTPPKGGLVLRVQAKVLGGYDTPKNQWQEIFQSAVSRDNLWVTAAETETLIEGRFPDSLQRRIARFHLVDNTRGEPPMWKPESVRQIDLTIRQGKITGAAHLETRSKDRGYTPQMLGFIDVQDRRVVRFDLVAEGDFWGEGRYTKNAPKGRFPLAISFTLADGTDIADRIPPQGSRGWVPGYLNPR